MSAPHSPTFPNVAGGSHPTHDNPSAVFLQAAFEKLQNAKEVKKIAKLKEAITSNLQQIKQILEASQELAPGSTPKVIPPDIMRSSLQALQSACSSRIPSLVTISLDCIAKLISYNIFKDSKDRHYNDKDSTSDLSKQVEEKAASSGAKPDTRTLGEIAIDMVCDCNTGESTDEKVHLQIVKALLAAVTAADEPIHGNILLKAIRTTWNIFLVSKVSQIQTVAQGSLTQMINTVFARAVAAQAQVNNAPSPVVSSKSMPFASTAASPDAESMRESAAAEAPTDLDRAVATALPASAVQSPDEGTTTEAALDTVSLNSPLAPGASAETSTVNEREPFADSKLGPRTTSILFFQDPEYPTAYEHSVRDAYLVFRALSKLSMKSVNEQTSSADVKSTSVNSRVLSLQHILLALKSFPALFRTTCYIPGQNAAATFLDVVRNTMCLSIAHALTSPNPSIYKVALEMFVAVVQQLRYSLKREIEIFISEILLSILEMKTAATAQKIAILNAFSVLLRKPQILVEMYINYDCSQEAMDNTFERLMNTMAKLMGFIPFTIDPNVPSSQAELPYAALEALCVAVHSLSEWVTSSVRSSVSDTGVSINGNVTPLDDPNQLESDKQKKTMLNEAIHEFNIKPKKGISFLQSHSMLSDKPEDIAHWLMNTDGLNKKVLGEYMGDGDPECIAVMHHFVDSLDFTGMSFVDALRHFLQYFRLPGESQKIDRYMLKFAERYYNNNKHQEGNHFANADTAYVLAYSVIMLNTDLYNPQVKRRMTKEDFIKNNRGINDNEDLPSEVLNSIFDAIDKEEIKLKDDPLASTSKIQIQSAVSVSNRARKEVFTSALDEILNRIEVLFDKKKRKSTNWVAASHSDHVKNMMELVWMAVLAALSTLLQKSDDANITKMTLDTFKDCIVICCCFDLDLARSAFITTLSNFTLLSNANEMKSKNFGAIKILLDVALLQGNSLKKSWLEVLKCISQLEKIQVIGPEKSNLNQSLQQETTSQSIVVATDKIYSASVKLSGPAIVDFVSALCTVSNEEIPRMFSLTKLVEISYYNMQRIRLEWVNIWNILGNHFNIVACNEAEQVSFFALDSLRQLSMKFLEKEELSNFRFQREFLRPFEHTVSHHSSAQVRDFVIRCLQQMVQARASVLRSGWKTILSVFTIVASQETLLRIFSLCFDVTKLIMTEHSETILRNGCFSDAMDNLLAFCRAKLSQKISLQAVELIHKSCKPLVQSETVDEDAWFSLLYALSRAVNDCELEVRTRALQYLFTLLKEQGSQFSMLFWHRISSEILFELFSPITKPSEVRGEELSVWLSTTMVQALRQFLDLFGSFYSQLSQKLPEILSLIKACILQENEMLARLGSSCLQQLMETNCQLMSDTEWGQICFCISELFQETEATPLFDPATQSPSDKQQSVFQQILVHCVLQLLLIQTLLDTIPNPLVYSHIPNTQLFVLVQSLEKSYHFSKKFNDDVTLRTNLWKCGFTNKLPNLVKQETSSLTCILQLLFQIYSDTSLARAEAISKIDEKLITLAVNALQSYGTMDIEDRKRNMTAWKTVLLTILKGLLQLQEDQFRIHIKKFYRLVIDLLLYDVGGEIRAKLHAVLTRAETYLC